MASDRSTICGDAAPKPRNRLYEAERRQRVLAIAYGVIIVLALVGFIFLEALGK